MNIFQNNLIQRIITSVFLVPVLFYFILQGGFWLYCILIAAVIIGAKEYSFMSGRLSIGVDDMTFISGIVLCSTACFMRHPVVGIIIALIFLIILYKLTQFRLKNEYSSVIPNHINRLQLLCFGYIYLAITFGSIMMLRNADPMRATLLLFFILTIASDTFAYICGRIIGGKKLMPKVSPNKTWSGLIGAIICTAVTSTIFASYLHYPNILFFIYIGAIAAVVVHIGDLIQSKFKRYVGVKDSGNIILGHGGVLDRLDGALLLALFLNIINFLTLNPILHINS